MKSFFPSSLKNADWQRLVQVVSSSAILTSANIGSALMTLVTLPFIIHSVGMAGYGVLVMVQAFTLIVSGFFDGQAWQVYIRLVGLNYDKSAALRVALILDVVAFFGLIVATLTASQFMQSWQLQSIPFDICGLFAFSILNHCISSWVGVLRLEGKFIILALTTLLPSLLRLLVLALLSVSIAGLSLRMIAWVYTVSEIIRFIVITYYGWRVLGKTTVLACKNAPSVWMAVKKFTFWNWLMNLVDLPVQYVDSLLVGRLLSIESVGIYGAIKRIASACSQISAPLYQVIFPEFMRLVAARTLLACRHLLWRSAGLMVVIGVSVMGVLYALRTFWMPMFGLTLHETFALFLLMTFKIAGLAFTAVHPLMNALGLVRAGCYIVLMSNAVFLGLVYAWGHTYALTGIIMATGVQVVLVIGAKVCLVERYIRLEERVK